jgi:hypothetical protein
MRKLLALFLILTACSSTAPAPDKAAPDLDPNSEAAQKEMCIEENVGFLRFSRSFLEEFCPSLKSQTELTCLRFVHATKEWWKACPGVDTADKLECISVVQNGAGRALLESLEKCRQVKNRKQVFCISRSVAKSGVPLQPESVQECLDRN